EERLWIECGALRVEGLVGRPAGASARGGRLAAGLDAAAGRGGRQVGWSGVVGGGPGLRVLGETRRASDRLAVRHRLGLRAVPWVHGCKTRAGQGAGRSIAMWRELRMDWRSAGAGRAGPRPGAAGGG